MYIGVIIYFCLVETGKVFLASFYDTNNSTNYVNELLESVKFE